MICECIILKIFLFYFHRFQLHTSFTDMCIFIKNPNVQQKYLETDFSKHAELLPDRLIIKLGRTSIDLFWEGDKKKKTISFQIYLHSTQNFLKFFILKKDKM